MKRLVPLFLAIVLAFSLFFGFANADYMYVLCRPNDYVNVRSLPTTKGDLAGILDCGDCVETTGVTKKDKNGRTWYEVCGFEGEAWVCAMYLQNSKIEIGKCTGYVASLGRTALRRSPNGKRIKWLKNGAEVTILAMSEEWALTTGGYVKRECLDVTYW